MGTTKAKKEWGKNNMNAPCRRRWRIFSFFGSAINSSSLPPRRCRRLQCQNGIMVPSSLSSRVGRCRQPSLHTTDALCQCIDTNENDDIVIRPTQPIISHFSTSPFFPGCLVCLVCRRRLDARLPHYLRQIFNIASVEYIFYILLHIIFRFACHFVPFVCVSSRCLSCCAVIAVRFVLAFFFFVVCRFFTCAFPS